MSDPNIDALTVVARALGELRGEVVFGIEVQDILRYRVQPVRLIERLIAVRPIVMPTFPGAFRPGGRACAEPRCISDKTQAHGREPA